MSERINKVITLAKSFAAGFPGLGNAGLTGTAAISKEHLKKPVIGVNKSSAAEALEDKVYKQLDGRDYMPKKPSAGGMGHLKAMHGMVKPKLNALQSGAMSPRQNNKVLNSEV